MDLVCLTQDKQRADVGAVRFHPRTLGHASQNHEYEWRAWSEPQGAAEYPGLGEEWRAWGLEATGILTKTWRLWEAHELRKGETLF